MGLVMLDKGKHFPQSYARMLFTALGIHQDGQLLVTIDPWDERRARELMQEKLLLRLYNHVYVDPVYWNNLDVKDRVFQLASAIAVQASQWCQKPPLQKVAVKYGLHGP